jgi:hypothetical protein
MTAREGAVCCEWLSSIDLALRGVATSPQGELDRCPGPDDVGKQWIAAVWDLKDGKPRNASNGPPIFQIVPELPWLRRIDIER